MATIMRFYTSTTNVPKAIKRACLIATVISLVGCGQKGALYLEQGNTVVGTDSDTTVSTSQPQDAAFAGIDDDEYERDGYLEQQQILPDTPDDPNDY